MAERGGSALLPRYQRTIDGRWERLGGGEAPEDTDTWQTPRWLVRALAKTLAPAGFLDPSAAHGSPMTKCAARAFVWPEEDAFEVEDWPALPVICNPPWSATGRWVRLLLSRARGGVALIAPLRLDTVWVRVFAPTVVLVPPSRLRYLDPTTGLEVGSPRTSSGVYLRGVGPFSARARRHSSFEKLGWTEWRPRWAPRQKGTAAAAAQERSGNDEP
jgi:hypothetical protein